MVIQHVVRPHEGFDQTAQALLRLLRNAQRKHPGVPRYLALDIEGHRNAAGEFDDDISELQTQFMAELNPPAGSKREPK